MVFSTMTFLLCYLPIVLIVYYIAPKKTRNFILMATGLLFYAWGEPVYVLAMMFCIVVDYGAGILMERFNDKQKSRLWIMIAAVIVNIGMLAVFKYSSFIIQNINAVFKTAIPDPQLPLPIGISFYTFQSMSYVIDLYRKEIKVQKNIVNFAAYVSLFPQLIAGPIVRYSDVEHEINERTINEDKLANGIAVFLRGLGKKALLANNIGMIWTSVKGMDTSSVPVLTAWIGILAFTFQIYYDFSGYSDMAVGLGKMLGFNFPPNFDHPYTSKSITEFWRRWHMTLSGWFKSYVYIPLGGNRKGVPRTILNLLIVWMLTGLWHGASWNFVLWGLYFGILLILEKFVYGKYLEKLPSFFRWLYTFVLVVFSWVLFELNNPSQIFAYLGAMFGLNGAGFANSQSIYLIITNVVVFAACILASGKFLRNMFVKLRGKYPRSMNTVYVVSLMAIFAVSMCYLVTSTYNPFLYFNF